LILNSREEKKLSFIIDSVRKYDLKIFLGKICNFVEKIKNNVDNLSKFQASFKWFSSLF